VSAWLDPLRAALDREEQSTTWFFRDDDAGWADQQLYRMLDCFAEFGVAIDLAIIPAELRDELAATLLERRQKSKNLLGLHQHGFSHLNHEVAGRKCEFGASRSFNQQCEDIARGADLLRESLGSALDPIFTPPWNRCSAATISVLRTLGFKALSRDVSAAPLLVEEIVEIPVSIDWSKHRRAEAVDLAVIGNILAAGVGLPRVGIMLHHAVMDEADLSALRELLQLICEHRSIQCIPMRDFIHKEK
jgi:peptidoglycan/xylan/chitin deacetylase (PgdA/CDA1 family)